MDNIKKIVTDSKKECLYLKKWQEIWNGDRRTRSYKKLEKILRNGARKLRVDYGEFWKEK